MYQTKLLRVLVLAALAVTPSVFAADVRRAAAAVHINSFDKVDDHIYRGAQPSDLAIQELGAMGIKLVIDLREPGERSDFERHEVESLGMKYRNMPLARLSAPRPEQIQQILALLLADPKDPVFIHCWRGKDRTGIVVACYRIQHDGWSNGRAFEEAQQHGMSSLERPMRLFILHYSPLPVSNLQALK